MRRRAYFTRRSPSTTSQTCSTSYPKLNASASSYGSTQNGHSSGSGFTKHGPIRMYAFCKSRTRTCSRGCSSLNVSTRRAGSLYALSSTSFAWYVLSPFFLAFFCLPAVACALSVDTCRGIVSSTPLPPNLLPLGPRETQQSKPLSNVVSSRRRGASR
jgi:hypothetical protein